MWTPKYIISNQLLRTSLAIGETLGTIKAHAMSGQRLDTLLLEARALSTFASTSIEGNPLPLTDVRRLLKNAPAQVRDTEREILNYNRALEWVYEQVSQGRFEFSAKTYCHIQGLVVEGLMDNPFDVGQFRQKPVVIRDPRIADSLIFLPPNHRDVTDLCQELFDYINANLTTLDPLMLAGLFHKQAVIIHPFMDGNGRSTRLMTSALLGMAGFDFWSIFSFEAYYQRNITRYFEVVGERGDYYDIRDQIDFTAWLEYFADGILDELKRVQKTLPANPERLEPHHQQILTYIDQNGSISQREYGHISGRSLSARKQDFTHLLNLGLIEKRGGGRSVYYVRGE